MHAYLLVGTDAGELRANWEKLAKRLSAKVMEFPIAKIEDTRQLNSLIRLSFNEPTLIVCPKIHDATEEALNAFLKNLEEPQDNIFFALTAPTVRKVLPTITSRCQVLRIAGTGLETANHQKIKDFLSMSVSEKLSYIDKIRDRDKAMDLVENTVNLLHSQLHQDGVKYKGIVRNIEAATETLTRLKGNGNVNLQLTNMVINFV